MDYLSAIQFAAALNLGYIVPNILKKMYDVLNNINNSYMGILQDVKDEIIVRINEICKIEIIETKDNKSTQKAIDRIKKDLSSFMSDCDSKKNDLERFIDGFTSCSGFRSVFFYSCLYSISVLLLIPFCHQHNNIWAFQLFLFTYSGLSSLYLLCLFIKIIITKKDIGCGIVLWRFMLFISLSFAVAIVNDNIAPLFIVKNIWIKLFSSLCVLIPFLPGAGCMLFLILLILYSNTVAKLYRYKNRKKFKTVDKIAKQLDDFNNLLEGQITYS